MGTQLQGMMLSDADFGGHIGCNEALNIWRPEIIEQVHVSYAVAGAQVLETNTFGANRFKLAEYGLADRLTEVNREAVNIARKSARKNGGPAPIVCGCMGPTGIVPSTMDAQQRIEMFEQLASSYDEQASVLVQAGCDLLLLETMQDLLEVRAALVAFYRNEKLRSVPVMVQISMDQGGHMLYGSDVSAFVAAVAWYPMAAIGLNCNTGPSQMRTNVLELLKISPVPVSIAPNNGMPDNVNGAAHYSMTPDAFVGEVASMVINDGVAIVGGCCGTTPEHIARLVSEIGNVSIGRKELIKSRCFVSAGLAGIDLCSVSRPIIIGERLNAQGSKKTKEFLLARNMHELSLIGEEQQLRGSAVLDLCVAVNEEDNEISAMSGLVTFLSSRLTAPFCIDSTEPAVFEAALRACPGPAIVNSINLEHGGKKARETLTLAAQFGSPVMALTIDDKGMAQTVDRKLDCARRLVALCEEYGVLRHTVFIDPLVFTLASGDQATRGAALDSIEAIRRIKEEFPGVNTSMGISNVSFGLKPAARRVLNNLLLHHAVIAGLDAAIFNPLHVDNINSYAAPVREAGEALIFNRESDALMKFIALFATEQKAEALIEKGETLSADKKLFTAILRRDRREIGELIATLLGTISATDILNTILLPAMAEVGERMARGEMILPFVLQAAEVMKEAVTILEPHLKAGETTQKGSIVMATVFGDVHDIGKNLVASILGNQGFRVIDLGKQVPLDDIIAAVQREKPDAVGLSALLVTTSREMKNCVVEFDRRGWTIPLLIGGAAVNRGYAAQIAQLPDGRRYAGGVYYGKDAFEATMFLSKLKKGISVEVAPIVSHQTSPEVATTNLPTEAQTLTYDLVDPPFLGTSAVLTWDTEELLKNIDKTELFKGYWTGGKLPASEFERVEAVEFEPAFARLCKKIIDEELIEARGLYGFFPVYTLDDKLVLIDPSDPTRELANFLFPRMPRRNNRSLADFLNPEGDILAIQMVTIGCALGRACKKSFGESHQYSDGFYLHGIGNLLAEELAERVTTEIRRALFIDKLHGKRYSFGYPGLPGVEGQAPLFEILAIEERLGVELTQGFQMNPEHSTMGIFVHHPKAGYLA